MNFLETEEFKDFVSAEFDKTTQYITIEEMAEFASGSIGDAVEQFLMQNHNGSDICILTYIKPDKSKHKKRIRVDLISDEINNLTEFGCIIDNIN